ncbi:hypothetical protein [Gryllotalpicola protaetiae]|nr:hypothetical protein [Gryllotalpicola protaetiae]
MNLLLLLIAIIAIVLLITGGFVATIHWLLWVGIVLLVIALVVWIVRLATGRRKA